MLGFHTNSQSIQMRVHLVSLETCIAYNCLGLQNGTFSLGIQINSSPVWGSQIVEASPCFWGDCPQCSFSYLVASLTK